GWDTRSVWIQNGGDQEVVFNFEVDQDGDGTWTDLEKVAVPAHSEREYVFTENQTGEWIRVQVDRPTIATVYFTYNDEDTRKHSPDAIFTGLSDVGDSQSYG